jgi:hypothetical protein
MILTYSRTVGTKAIRANLGNPVYKAVLTKKNGHFIHFLAKPEN